MTDHELGVNPDIKIQLTSWSAPAWMKSNGSLTDGGSLLPQYQELWADYIVKGIKAYETEGIPVWATSVANEPSITQTYPSMITYEPDSARIVRDYLAPALAEAELPVRIFAADDMPFLLGYPRNVIDSDPHVSSELASIALHGYDGVGSRTSLTYAEQLSTLHRYYPNKEIFQTELTPGCAGYDTILLLMHTMRNWAQMAITWNLVLNEDNGPFHTDTFNAGCKPLVVVDETTGDATYTEFFYQQGHFSKFVRPGAVRIDTNDNADVRNVAFVNTDGSKVLVAWNTTGSSKTFSVNWGGQHFDYTLAAGSIATFTWSGTPAIDPSGWGDSSLSANGANPFGGGLRTGTWTITDADTLSQTALGGGMWPSIYVGYPDRSDFTADVEMTGVTRGTTAANPKYGMYACYRDESNYMQAWIDPDEDEFVSHAVVGGTDLGWSPVGLPGGFDPTDPHVMRAQRTGNSFAFSLDGSLLQTRVAPVPQECQLGLVTEDYAVNFDDIAVLDPLRWGDSTSSTSPSIWGGGRQRGDWAVAGPDSATSVSLGSGWNSIFRGYLIGDSIFSVDVQAVKEGATATYPKYGIYAAYRNVDNYVQGWIDPGSGVFATHAVVGGSDLGWNTVALPGGFDASQYHELSVDRSGNVFTFRLDGSTIATRTASVGSGQVGLVTEDYAANFRRVLVSSDAGAASIDEDAWYHLVNRRSLRQLSVLAGGTANSTPGIIYRPVGATDQLWRIEDAGGGLYQLFNQRSGRALSVLAGGTANNADAIIYDDIDAADQFWEIVPSSNGGGYVNLVNAKSDRLLSVLGGGTVDSTHAMIYDDVDATDQDWILVPTR